jgi:hypothetical protein
MSELDFIIREPSENADPMPCKVCGELMEVKRSVMGRWSLGAAMSHIPKIPRDLFTCPHRDEDWHNQAIAIMRAIQETPSEKMASIMQSELAEIIKYKQTSKVNY